MSRKEIARLLDHIEPQGVTATRTTKGIMLRLPDRSTAMLHFTGSDVREQHNVRARLRRAGVTWPTDGDPLGANITDHRPSRTTLARVQAALAAWEGKRINASQLCRQVRAMDGGSMNVLQAQRALYTLGWTPTGPTTGRKWMRPLLDEPEPVEEAAQEQPESVELRPAALVAQVEPVHLAAPDDAPTTPTGAPAREFIDTVDSWTADQHSLPADLTLSTLWQMLEAMGLHAELRVWRVAARL